MGSIPTSGTNLKLLAVRNNGKLKEILGSSPRAGSYLSFIQHIGAIAYWNLSDDDFDGSGDGGHKAQRKVLWLQTQYRKQCLSLML